MPDHATSTTLHALAAGLNGEPGGDLRPGNHAERLAGLSLLAAGMAEDLSNLLAPILMAAGLLGERLRDGHDGAALAMLEESARRGEALMRQIVALAGGQEGRETVVRPAQLLEDVRRIVAETFPRAIDVDIEVGVDQVELRGEPTELHQVLMAFCTDAREAMPAGGKLTLGLSTVDVAGRATASSREAATDAQGPQRFVVFTVSDTGVGTKTPMPGHARLDRTPEIAAQARAAAEAIIQAHGGFVEIDAQSGRGTTARIHVPALAASPQHDVRPPAPPRGRDELVLVVDDEASVRSITAEVLRAFGYRVVTATTGAEAVTMYARHGLDISAVLLDMVMPVTDGVSTIHALRTVDPNVQIIAASVSPSGGPALAPLAPAIAAFLPKPYTSTALLQIVRAVLDRNVATA